ncbi:MAG TPA: LysR family transcriptional regulator [Solirubrobacteraceae bacterium]
MDVEMRHLRALVTVAEELNFTRAAERLHLTQQALSGQIRQLEDRVGTRLVERDPRRVHLTAAGTALCDQARPLLVGAQQAIAAARAIGGETPRLTVGYIAPLTRRITAPTMQLFTDRYPEVEVTIHFASLLDSSGGLRDGAADVAILYGEFEHAGLELRFLFREPRGIAIPAKHPLASKPQVTIEDFIAEPLIAVPVSDHVNRDFWTAARHRAGKPPRIGATVQTLDGLIEAISAGLGIASTIAPVIDALGSSAGVVFRLVSGLEPLDFWVGRHEGDERVQVTAFMQAAVAAHLREHD